MSLGAQASKTNASQLVTVRFDRKSSEDGIESLGASIGSVIWTKLFRIPVGYQDESGFHSGEPQVEESWTVEQ